jgi:Fungal Zn(2)-Cys(6) binuclear cluster domain
MPHVPEAKQTNPGVDRKGFSCLTCRQRKIKCDRCNPCSNCIRIAGQCSFVPPLRGKPRRKKAPKEGLHAKLRRYEELLRSYGADIAPSSNDNISDGDTMSDADVDTVDDADSRDESHASSSSLHDIRMRLVSKNGSSRYFDKYDGPVPQFVAQVD